MKNERILVTGGSGMIGSALKNEIPNAIFVSSSDFDLRDSKQCSEMFKIHRPEYVIHLAARVGGVKANYKYLGEFYHDNILINTNVLKCASKLKVKKLLSMLSTCVYPAATEYPLIEENIHQGEPHWTNFAYAYAKRMLDVQSRAYRKQHNCNFITAIPNNMYGINDNFHLEDSHVIPAMIRKIHEAKINNSTVELWGDGSPIREFTYSQDIAKIILFLLENYNGEKPINIGNVQSISIKELALTIKEIVGLSSEIKWDTTKLSGQYKKPSSNKKLLDLGFSHKDYTPIDVGLRETYRWFKDVYPKVRGYKN